MIDEISIPARVEDGSTECVRILVQPSGGNVFLLRHNVWEDADPGAWGMIAVDLLRHAARAMEDLDIELDGKRQTREELFERMREIFLAEIDHPTAPSERLTDA